MFNQFCINDIKLSLSNKTITIVTNFKIEERTVNLNTVKLKDTYTGAVEDYTLLVKGSEIIITFRDWPKHNHPYMISVSTEVLDKLERPLNAPLNKTVMFESQIKYKTKIIRPKATETIKGKELSIKVTTTPEDETIKDYLYQVALDNAFCNIVHELNTSDSEAYFTFNADGQYFVRARVQDNNNSDAIGQWSETIDFVMVNTNLNVDCECEEKEEELSPFLEDMLSMDTVLMDIKPLEIIGIEPNGKTDKTMLIYFNQNIDIKSLPNHVLMLRRDL